MYSEKKREAIKKLLDEVTLKDVGGKESFDKPCAEPCLSSKKDHIYYPNLFLDSRQLPEMEGYGAGDKISFVVEGSVVSASERQRDGEDKKCEYSIEIKKMSIA